MTHRVGLSLCRWRTMTAIMTKTEYTLQVLENNITHNMQNIKNRSDDNTHEWKIGDSEPFRIDYNLYKFRAPLVSIITSQIKKR